MPVYRYWVVKPPRSRARALLSFSDEAPALRRADVQGGQDRPGLALDHAAGPPGQADGTRCVERVPLPRATGCSRFSPEPTVPYLAGTSNEQLNFEAGENVRSDPRPRRRDSRVSS